VSVEDISAVLDDIAGEETPDIGETVEETLEPPLISLEETDPETPFGEKAKAEEVTSEPDLEMTDVETKLMEGVTEDEVEGEETVPELPTWLAGIDEESSVIETPEWTPTAEVIEEQESQVLPAEEQPSQINLNKAGLVELEHLPGVGFIKAQAIIEYRESIGPFASVEDLQNVSGIGPSLIEELRELIIVDVPVEAAALEGPTDEHQVIMIQARNALIEGDINHSLEHYNKLIQSQQMLPDVIQDLNEALYRFPVDIGIWQTLGDALMRMGRIQEALDAYTKAEELLR
jgi:comEA protein